MVKTSAHKWAERLQKARECELSPQGEEAHLILHALTMDVDVSTVDAYNYIVAQYPTTHLSYVLTQMLREFDTVGARVIGKHADYLRKHGRGDAYLVAEGKRLSDKARQLRDSSHTALQMRLAWERDLHRETTHDHRDQIEKIPRAARMIYADPLGRIRYDDGSLGPSARDVAGCGQRDPRSYMQLKQHIIDQIERDRAFNCGLIDSNDTLTPTCRGKKSNGSMKARRKAKRAQHKAS